MKLLLLTTILALACVHVFAQEDYCFGKDTDRTQTRHFTSKTAYQIIKSSNIEKQYLVPGCEPKKIWILHRHGTRLPSKGTIKKSTRLEELRDLIVKNYRVTRTIPDKDALCQEDLIALQMWKWNASIVPEHENYLTSQGYEDLRGTAKLYQKYYPTVLAKDYDSQTFLFRHTDTQRTTESFKAFAEGLFGINNNAVPEAIPEKDLLLRPYDYCESWNEHDYTGPSSENYKYRHSTLWNETMKDISTRLGFSYTLETTDVDLMYDMCRYEQAWQVDRTSVWCAAFLPAQVTVFEYDDDMKYFYKSGYGFDDNTHLNCRAVQDMLTRLSTNEGQSGIMYFGHSTGVQTLISALGINKDTLKLNSTNYNSLAGRKWKTSNIDPFAANFVAVKYQCDADLVDKEKVVFFLNQDAVELDWCNVGLCNWSEVLKRYDTVLKANCDDYYCRKSGASAVGVSLISLLLAAIIYLIY